MFRDVSQASKAPGLSEFVNQLGRIAEREGDLATAQELLVEGLDLANERGNVVGIAESLVALGDLLLQKGHVERAGNVLGAVVQLCASHGTVLPRSAESERARLDLAVEELLGQEAKARAIETGSSLAPDQIVALASFT